MIYFSLKKLDAMSETGLRDEDVAAIQELIRQSGSLQQAVHHVANFLFTSRELIENMIPARRVTGSLQGNLTGEGHRHDIFETLSDEPGSIGYKRRPEIFMGMGPVVSDRLLTLFTVAIFNLLVSDEVAPRDDLSSKQFFRTLVKNCFNAYGDSLRRIDRQYNQALERYRLGLEAKETQIHSDDAPDDPNRLGAEEDAPDDSEQLDEEDDAPDAPDQ